MHVADVMTARPVTVRQDDLVAHALRISQVLAVQHLVVTENGLPVGLACARCDLAHAAPNDPVSMHMSPPVSIGAYENLAQASHLMCRKGIGALIVRGGEYGWGITTRGDLLRAGFVSPEDEGLFFCASCGAHEHVHPVPNNDWVAFCSECWERAAPPRFGEDLGGSD